MRKLGILNRGNLCHDFTTIYSSNLQRIIEGQRASMNCLVCGHKLAIFRKLSLGDFCCQEHRMLFVKEQSDRGLARLTDSTVQSRKRAIGTRVYAHFFLDEVLPVQAGRGYFSHGPLAPMVIVRPPAQSPALLRVARPQHTEFTAFIAPQRGSAVALGFGEARHSLRLPCKLELTRNGGPAAGRIDSTVV